MNLTEKDGYIYYYTKGTSMWPTLIPNDILRAETVSFNMLFYGDIIVLPGRKDKQTIHRLIRIKQESENTVVLFSAGDRSGNDIPIQIIESEELLRIIGVLRRGRWRTPGKKPFPLASQIPGVIVRIHCKFIRKLFW
jgi:signal peptidase I